MAIAGRLLEGLVTFFVPSCARSNWGAKGGSAEAKTLPLKPSAK